MTALPAGLAAEVEAAIGGLGGGGARVVRSTPIPGGCVNPSARIDTEAGDAFFLKWNARAPDGLFAAEADGLAALRAATTLRVPSVLGVGGGGRDVPAWLLLEYVDAGRPGRGYAEALGEGLATLHRAAAGGWGWERDNFIGPLPQANPVAPSWGAFWRDARLAPQLRRARGAGHFDGPGAALLDDVLARTEALLAEVGAEGPALLHGDLWGGNVFADGRGRPVLVDPATYRGHREVDLAMSELFGGFPTAWPAAYEEAWPVGAGYGVRRGLYQLYYLLVHVNLFGAGYEAGCLTAARSALTGS